MRRTGRPLEGMRTISEKKMGRLPLRTRNHGETLTKAVEKSLLVMESTVGAKIKVAISGARDIKTFGPECVKLAKEHHCEGRSLGDSINRMR